ncbi:MAG: hypothetical protein D6801_02340 [Alphaproteobacteria bacterium]|nr:MAG: hypothetical protein D6801_02340 [Alphaproteobacteria bacterium]
MVSLPDVVLREATAPAAPGQWRGGSPDGKRTGFFAGAGGWNFRPSRLGSGGNPTGAPPQLPKPFHLAINVTDLDAARAFYGGLLGCAEGRSTESWVDFDFFGHQLSLHLGPPFATADTGAVGEHKVAMPHFGLVLPLAEWRALADRLEAAGIDWVIAPVCRFPGEAGEQWTMFFRDPSGNPIEIKGFADMGAVFSR